MSVSGFRVLLQNVQGVIQHMVKYSGYYSKYNLQRLVQDSAYYKKISRVLFSIWFIIQGIIRNMTCSVWFIIIQNTTCSVWFRIQGIIKKCTGYNSAYGSIFSVLFKIRPAASVSGFSVLLKNIQGIIQHLVHYPGYYSKYRLQCLVQDSAYYSKNSRVLFSVWFINQGITQNTTCSVWFRIQRIIQNTTCSIWFIIQGIIQNTTCSVWFRIQGIVHFSGYY